MARSDRSRVFDERRDSRGGFRNDRRNEITPEQSSGTVFIPRLPFELEEQDLHYLLDKMKIQYDSARLKKKSEGNVFAFV